MSETKPYDERKRTGLKTGNYERIAGLKPGLYKSNWSPTRRSLPASVEATRVLVEKR